LRLFGKETPSIQEFRVRRCLCTANPGRNTGKDKAGKKIWTRIGAVWPNKSGKGFNLTWDYLPLGDGVTVMLPFDKDDANASPSEI